MDSAINLVSAQLKKLSVKFVNRLVTLQMFIEANTEKQNKIMTGKIMSQLDLQEIIKPPVHLVVDDTEVLETTPKEDIPWIQFHTCTT